MKRLLRFAVDHEAPAKTSDLKLPYWWKDQAFVATRSRQLIYDKLSSSALVGPLMSLTVSMTQSVASCLRKFGSEKPAAHSPDQSFLVIG